MKQQVGSSIATRAALAGGTIGELIGFLLRGGRWWLLPMVFVLIATTLLLAVISAIEYVAPFVYTVF